MPLDREGNADLIKSKGEALNCLTAGRTAQQQCTERIRRGCTQNGPDAATIRTRERNYFSVTGKSMASNLPRYLATRLRSSRASSRRLATSGEVKLGDFGLARVLKGNDLARTHVPEGADLLPLPPSIPRKSRFR